MDFKIALEQEEKTIFMLNRIWMNATGDTVILDFVHDLAYSNIRSRKRN